jgi:hypothetical protein
LIAIEVVLNINLLFENALEVLDILQDAIAVLNVLSTCLDNADAAVVQST